MIRKKVTSDRRPAMIVRPLRWIARLERSYFLALSGFIAVIVASIFVTFAPATELTDGSTLTLMEDVGAGVLILILMPVLVLAVPLVALPQAPGPRRRNDKVNSVASTVVMLAFTIIFPPPFGLFYVPALILSASSSASLIVGRRGQARMDANMPADSSEDDGRLTRSARKRARLEASGETQKVSGETPLASSRRRRGKKRRRS